jgi:hypothetical protein
MPAEMAFEPKAPMTPRKVSLSPNSFCHSANAAEPATIEPASM